MSSNVHTIPEAHEILMEQLPDWFKPVLEYIAIMQAYAVELSGVEAAAAKIQANYFVETADSDTLTMSSHNAATDFFSSAAVRLLRSSKG